MYWYISYTKYISLNWIIFLHIRLHVRQNFLRVTTVTSRLLLQHKTTRLSIRPYIHAKKFPVFELLRRQTSESEIRCRCLRSKTRREVRKKEIELAGARRAIPPVLEPDDSGEIHEDRFRNNGAVNFVAIEARNGKDRKYNHRGDG